PYRTETFLFGNQLHINAHLTFHQNVDVEEYLIFYSDNSRLKTIKIKCADKQLEHLIDCPEGAKYYRFAIRLEGEGYFQINKLSIEQKNKTVDVTNGKQYKSNSSEEGINDVKEDITTLNYHRKTKSSEIRVA
ncbi:hypothetical protein R0K17_18640, partial [Planococcus sp. SIMBA_143]